MIRLLPVAILVILIAPLYAQGKQPNVAKLMADARNAVGVIGSDKAKTQTYCQIVDLGGQMVQAVQEKDRKKAKALFQKIHQLQKQLGPEFVALINGLDCLDPNSSDGREIASIIESLDRSCPD
jgi:hypothetical protein